MVTVGDVNKTFAEKGIHIKLPLDESWVVKKLDVMERTNYPGGVRILFEVRCIDNEGKEFTNLLVCEGSVDKERKAAPEKAPEPLKSTKLPVRHTMTFANDDEAKAYLKEAISDLLRDKGYYPGEETGADLYFEKDGQKFFVNLAVRCDEEALDKAKQLIKLRRKQGAEHNYALVIPAIQEPLGLPLRLQERWISRNGEYLSMHHIGVYGVDNLDPNRLYPFTTFPIKDRELTKYFSILTLQWPMIRSRYVQERQERKRVEEAESE
jgi:hypothetical protein